jgi:hypothetical protein
VRLFEVDDRPVALSDPNNALVFDNGCWRKASVQTARKAVVDGYEMIPTEFAKAFSTAARTLATF